MRKRAFIIVLDSFGIGAMPDAEKFGDVGSDTLGAIFRSPMFNMPEMKSLGLFNIEGVSVSSAVENPSGSFARLTECSMGKDTTIGHWEIAGIVSKNPLPTYPNGFPDEVIKKFSEAVGRGVVCNMPYSGTKVLDDYGAHHMKTGDLIVYTSADSVFQIAAHEDIVSVDELYKYCEIAREQLLGEHGVGRVIARPFVGEEGNFKRTANRHDYSLLPPAKTVLDYIKEAGLASIGVGKIYDIFAGVGITEYVRNESNHDGMQKATAFAKKDWEGLCFVNLVDFDMMYGHRNDVDGYAACATEFDVDLIEFRKALRPDDIVIITADHGCDPASPSTDHSREYVPMVIFGEKVLKGVDLGTRDSFADIAATIADYLSIDAKINGESFLREVIK